MIQMTMNVSIHVGFIIVNMKGIQMLEAEEELKWTDISMPAIEGSMDVRSS